MYNYCDNCGRMTRASTMTSFDSSVTSGDICLGFYDQKCRSVKVMTTGNTLPLPLTEDDVRRIVRDELSRIKPDDECW